MIDSLTRMLHIITCEVLLAVRAANTLDKEIEYVKEHGIPEDDQTSNLSVETIMQHAEADTKRLDSITKKMPTTLAGITLALSVVSFGSVQIDSLTAQMNPWNIPVRILLYVFVTFAAAYFLIAGLCASKVHKTISLFRFSLEDEMIFTHPRNKARRHLEVLVLNRKVINKYSNLVDISHNAIRNAVFCIFLVAVIFAAARVSSPHVSGMNSSVPSGQSITIFGCGKSTRPSK